MNDVRTSSTVALIAPRPRFRPTQNERLIEINVIIVEKQSKRYRILNLESHDADLEVLAGGSRLARDL